jgi:hypothetical protein
MALMLNVNCRKISVDHVTHKLVKRHSVSPTKFIVRLSRIAN